MAKSTTTWVARVDSTDAARRVNLTVKAAIVIAFAIAIAVPLDHLDGKAMPMRVPLFVGSALVVPLVERFRRHPFDPYPHVADTLVVAPFLLDTIGNLLGAYEWFDRTDDVLHFVNWVLLVSAYEAFHFRRTTRTDGAVLLGYGVGAIAIIWWEALEWLIAETGAGGGLHLDYGDTIGDLILSSTGGLVGGLVGRHLFARPVEGPDPRRSRPPTVSSERREAETARDMGEDPVESPAPDGG